MIRAATPPSVIVLLLLAATPAVVVALSRPRVTVDSPRQLIAAEQRAQQVQGRTRRRIERLVFDALDVNQDGMLSRAEVNALPELAESFARLDSDHDGYLERTEFDAAMAAAFWAIGNLDETPVPPPLAGRR